VRTTHDAAVALAEIHSPGGARGIATALGFGELQELDSHSAASLGIGVAAEPRIAVGSGALRLLALLFESREDPRSFLAATAARLASRTPHILWTVCALQRGGSGVVVGTWSIERHPPRITALVADSAAVLDSDAATLLALADCAIGADVEVHARWLEILGRAAVGRRFFHELERCVGMLATTARGSVGEDVRREVALCHTSRLLFLSFLQAKRWLDGDRQFLSRTFDECMASGGGYERRVLGPLFFGTLNTRYSERSPRAREFGRIPFLNGGLFARTVSERTAALRFADEAFAALHAELLARFRFTVRENSSAWSEAAVDPEILGRAFESLMHPGERKSSGTFYTPQPLVEHLTSLALEQALSARAPSELTVLDPACGSGAFLVHVMERLAQSCIDSGDRRRPDRIRREILARCIFGVDRNPTAVWLCELRLWLSVVIDADEGDPMRVAPLPNLDRNIRTGDALTGAPFGSPEVPEGSVLRRLRERYSRATGRRKASLARTLDRLERSRSIEELEREIRALEASRRELIVAARGSDLFGQRSHRARPADADRRATRQRLRALRHERRRLAGGGAAPFSFSAHFGEVAARRGFDLVIGNPPWVRLHNVPPALRARLRERYAVFRAAPWRGGGSDSAPGRGFAAQPDVAAAFMERGMDLLRPGGTLAFLVPAKLWRSLAGAGARALFDSRAELLAVEDWTDAPTTFDAAVYPSIVVARRRSGDPACDNPRVEGASYRRSRRVRWSSPRRAIALDSSTGSPWLLVPPAVREAFDHLRSVGVAMANSAFGRPLLGLKSGMNDAFVVSLTGSDALAGAVEVRSAEGRRATVEADRLRPLLRGEEVREWKRPAAREHLIWTHAADGRPLRTLPPMTERWLRGWRSALASRTDRKPSHPWWTLYRTDGAAGDTPRVVWADIGRSPRALVLEPGDPVVPLNSCYVTRCATLDDAFALSAILNGVLAAAWLAVVAEPARGRYRRYLAWTTSLLPLPVDWARARTLLAPIARAAWEHGPPDAGALFEMTARAYGVRQHRLLPLIEWNSE
jgi:hypothetical protein